MNRDSEISCPVVVVGNATQDSAFFLAHLPGEDEVCEVRRNIKCLGGRGVVPALVAAALGLEVELCTVIGSDLKESFDSFLCSHRVGTSGVKWDGSSCGVTQYVAFIGEDTGTSVAVAKGPSLDWSSNEQQRKVVRQARAAYFSTNDMDFNLELLSCVTDGTPVIHNLGVRLANKTTYIDTMLAKSTVLIGNRLEMSTLEALTGMRPQNMFSSSPSLQNIITTVGRDGVWLFHRGEEAPLLYSAAPVESVRSPVGAGDSFAMGLLWSVLSNRPMSEGVQLGIALGALAVQSELSYPDLSRVVEIVR